MAWSHYIGNTLNSPWSDSIPRKQPSGFVCYIPTETREWTDHTDVSFIDTSQCSHNSQCKEQLDRLLATSVLQPFQVVWVKFLGSDHSAHWEDKPVNRHLSVLQAAFYLSQAVFPHISSHHFLLILYKDQRTKWPNLTEISLQFHGMLKGKFLGDRISPIKMNFYIPFKI